MVYETKFDELNKTTTTTTTKNRKSDFISFILILETNNKKIYILLGMTNFQVKICMIDCESLNRLLCFNSNYYFASQLMFIPQMRTFDYYYY